MSVALFGKDPKSLDISTVRRLEFAQPCECRRIHTDIGMRTVRPRAEFSKLAVGVRRVREALHS